MANRFLLIFSGLVLLILTSSDSYAVSGFIKRTYDDTVDFTKDFKEGFENSDGPIADRLLEGTIEASTPGTSGNTRELQRESIKYMFDPTEERLGRMKGLIQSGMKEPNRKRTNKKVRIGGYNDGLCTDGLYFPLKKQEKIFFVSDDSYVEFREKGIFKVVKEISDYLGIPGRTHYDSNDACDWIIFYDGQESNGQKYGTGYKPVWKFGESYVKIDDILAVDFESQTAYTKLGKFGLKHYMPFLGHFNNIDFQTYKDSDPYGDLGSIHFYKNGKRVPAGNKSEFSLLIRGQENFDKYIIATQKKLKRI